MRRVDKACRWVRRGDHLPQLLRAVADKQKAVRNAIDNLPQRVDRGETTLDSVANQRRLQRVPRVGVEGQAQGVDNGATQY